MAGIGDEVELAAVRERIGQLLERRNAGPLTAEEQAEYKALLETEEELLRRRHEADVLDLRETPASSENGD